MRLVPFSALVLLTGCTWGWDGFVVGSAEDAGTTEMDSGRLDAGPRRMDAATEDAGEEPADAGPRFDAGPDVDAGSTACPVAPYTEECAAGQVCARPEGPGARCCIPGRCLTAPVVGWVRRVSWGTPPNQGLVGAEPEWSSAAAFPLTAFTGSFTGETAPGASDLSSTWGGLYNDAALYLLINVQDDTLDVGAGAWDTHDAVEVQIDIDPGQPGAPDDVVSPDENRFARPAGASGTVALGPRMWSGTSAASQPNPMTDDWAVEAWIQWSDAMGAARPREGDLIGIEIIIHDVDFAGETADRWSWTPCDDGTAIASGLVRLISEGAPAPSCAGRCASSACPGASYVCERGLAQSCDP